MSCFDPKSTQEEGTLRRVWETSGHWPSPFVRALGAWREDQLPHLDKPSGPVSVRNMEHAYVLPNSPLRTSFPGVWRHESDRRQWRTSDIRATPSPPPMHMKQLAPTAGRACSERVDRSVGMAAVARSTKNGKTYACQIAGCSYQKPFTRQYELTRHLKDLHYIRPSGGDRDFYMCAIAHCSQRTKLWTRVDKFRGHIRKAHRDSSEDWLVTA